MASLYPLVVFYFFIIYGFVSSRQILLYMFFLSMPFGALAVIPTEYSAGLTLTPTPIVSAALIIKVFRNKGARKFLLELLARDGAARCLFYFTVVSVLVTYFSPRIFADSIDVVALRGFLDATELLRPTPQNISQITFLIISVLSVYTFAYLLRSEYMRQEVMKALYVGGVAVVITGLLDKTTQYVDIVSFLEPYRTATYALAVDVEVLGVKRVVGLMPEASSYGGLCLGFIVALYFFRGAVYDRKLREKKIPIVIFLLIIMVWISTSSSAYVGLAVFFLAVALQRVVSLYSTHGFGYIKIKFMKEAIFISVFLLVVLVAFLLELKLLGDMYEMFDRMVLQKTQSHSFEERGFWRDVAANSIVDSYGLGIGLGSTRASSGIVAIFSQTGLLGGILYYLFVYRLVINIKNINSSVSYYINSGLKYVLLPVLALDMIVGSTADFGPFMAFIFGLVLAVRNSRRMAFRSN